MCGRDFTILPQWIHQIINLIKIRSPHLHPLPLSLSLLSECRDTEPIMCSLCRRMEDLVWYKEWRHVQLKKIWSDTKSEDMYNSRRLGLIQRVKTCTTQEDLVWYKEWRHVQLKKTWSDTKSEDMYNSRRLGLIRRVKTCTTQEDLVWYKEWRHVQLKKTWSDTKSEDMYNSRRLRLIRRVKTCTTHSRRLQLK